MSYNILNDKNFVISSNIIKNIDKSLSLNDFLVLLYFINFDEFDLTKISKSLNINEEEVMSSLNNLMEKDLIEFVTSKDDNNQIEEHISLDKLYNKIFNSLKEDNKKKEDDSIFDKIAKEFNRKLTPIEMELINAWLESNTPIELIECALKEAAYNGVLTIKFMDQKLYEWNKHNLKTVSEIEEYLKTNNNSKSNVEFFEYDWVNDDE